jgi:chorismate mutase
VILPCDLHVQAVFPVPVAAPDEAWNDLPLPDLESLEAARTITFCRRVLLAWEEPDGEEPDGPTPGDPA